MKPESTRIKGLQCSYDFFSSLKHPRVDGDPCPLAQKKAGVQKLQMEIKIILGIHRGSERLQEYYDVPTIYICHYVESVDSILVKNKKHSPQQIASLPKQYKKPIINSEIKG